MFPTNSSANNPSMLVFLVCMATFVMMLGEEYCSIKKQFSKLFLNPGPLSSVLCHGREIKNLHHSLKASICVVSLCEKKKKRRPLQLMALQPLIRMDALGKIRFAIDVSETLFHIGKYLVLTFRTLDKSLQS